MECLVRIPNTPSLQYSIHSSEVYMAIKEVTPQQAHDILKANDRASFTSTCARSASLPTGIRRAR